MLDRRKVWTVYSLYDAENGMPMARRDVRRVWT